MKILLIVTAFNSLSQRIFTELRERGIEVAVELALGHAAMEEAVDAFSPDLILCPYLTRKIPASIWRRVPTIIIHPGIVGDRGPSSLDWAVMHGLERWGVTALQANDLIDGGDIWACAEFAMRDVSKATLYRREVAAAASTVVNEVVDKFRAGGFIPTPLNYDDPNVRGRAHATMTQRDRRIDWERDTTATIIRKIHAADSHPGVEETLLGVACFMYGAHREGQLRGAPKQILGKRHGAICLGSVDGAVWVTHLKEKKEKSLKLPATYVLKDRLKGVLEQRIALMGPPIPATFQEIVYVEQDDVGYLSFDFYNGAMNSEQCIRLKYAIDAAKERGIKVLVLMGGENFFSNGIHLTVMEDSHKQAEDGWSNIHSMNEAVKAILTAQDLVTVAAVRGNAGAGGVFLAAACDRVVIREGVVLNPHYQTIGLYGSEYWTYTLPRRVGGVRAQAWTEGCLPVGPAEAVRCGLADALLPREDAAFDRALKTYCREIAEADDYYDRLDEKNARRDEDETRRPLVAYREAELERMYPSFYDPGALFHRLRHDFVYKLCPVRTPDRLKFSSKDPHA